MAVFRSADLEAHPVRSGIPLGGIGAGKVEILPDGTLDNLTFLNNWESPANGKIGNFFALSVREGSVRTSWLLHTHPCGTAYPNVPGLVFDGQFPRARLQYELPASVPLKIELVAWSPFVPGETDVSCLPAAVFDFYFTATDPARPLEVSLLAAFRNLCGTWNVGRYNTVEPGRPRIRLRSRADNSGNSAGGDMAFQAVLEQGQTCSYLGEWNLKVNPFHIDPGQMRLEAFEHLQKTGRLPNNATGEVIAGERYDYAGALCVQSPAPAGKQRTVRFLLAWHMPQHPVGHRYERLVPNAAAALDLAESRLGQFHARTRTWIDRVLSAPAPEWLRDALLNNLYVLVSSSWLGRDGQFTLYEAPGICPLMGTLDVNFYASTATTLLFPELEKSHLRQFARAQRPDGYIPHDLGRSRINCPSDGTTAPPRWKDLNSKFVLMCLALYRRTRDRAFLDELFSHCAAAIEWVAETDHNRDGLPDNEGRDQTFDDWPFQGASAYTGSLYLAALRAFEEMARLRNDEALAQSTRLRFERGREGFIAQLWNGTYFDLWHDGGQANHCCASSQLAGQWYADLLDLGPLVPVEMIRSALETIWKLNASATPHGVANSVNPDGTLDRSSTQSGSVWPGAAYATASLMICEGMVEQGLEIARRAWQMVCTQPAGPWDQADNIDAETARSIFGDHYMRNMAVWSLVPALARHSPEMAAFLKTITGAGPAA